jgi:hypothetical protein
MREVATRHRIDAFLEALAREAASPCVVYLVGGTSAVIEGWRDSTIDIDLAIRPDSDAMLRAIPVLKDRLQVNVELASPDLFIPVPAGWEERSPLLRRIGQVTVRHFDFTAQALAKIERGHARDLADVEAMVSRGLITAESVRTQFELMEAHLYRFPAIDAASFRRAVDALFGS